ncbi:MAG: hypothetical protein SPL80_07975 [Bacilli bacterium]|nr:hypothetical protein [Bacilli bacterium]
MELEEMITRPGFEEIAQLVEEWRRVAERQKDRDVKVPLPNYYLTADEGFDFEGLFLTLAGELERSELLEFDGLRKVYSFYLKYSPAETSTFESFRLLYGAVEHELSKFGHPFGGILVVDITEWVEGDHIGEPKFLDFLSYMDTIDDRTLAVFLDRTGQGGASDEAFRRIDIGMRIQRINMVYKDADRALEQLENHLREYGFSLDDAFRPKLRETVAMVLKTPGADGEESIRQMALDMAYYALKDQAELSYVLNEQNSAAFLPDGRWTKAFGQKPRRRLGLVA